MMMYTFGAFFVLVFVAVIDSLMFSDQRSGKKTPEQKLADETLRDWEIRMMGGRSYKHQLEDFMKVASVAYKGVYIKNNVIMFKNFKNHSSTFDIAKYTNFSHEMLRLQLMMDEFKIINPFRVEVFSGIFTNRPLTEDEYKVALMLHRDIIRLSTDEFSIRINFGEEVIFSRVVSTSVARIGYTEQNYSHSSKYTIDEFSELMKKTKTPEEYVFWAYVCKGSVEKFKDLLPYLKQYKFITTTLDKLTSEFKYEEVKKYIEIDDKIKQRMGFKMN